ncbi:MAG: adenylate/guanylate cyclase domain-containing protein, partial [Deltaproteobacteria bacterium]|nr:adenylate/guanylate cyclase domain-containing protein [Deltaproteobacteria bacterium]
KYSGGKLDIPVDPEGNMLVNWPDRKECFSQYSAASLLSKDHEISLVDAFKNKVVVVAYSATGTTDMGVNPLFSSFLLSRIHSCSISTMLTNRFIRTVQSFPVVVPVAAVAALLFGALCTVIRHRYAVMVEIVCCAMYALVVFASFKYLSWEIPIAAPLLLFSVSATATLVSRAISMESQADRVSQALERYLSPQMLQSIIEQDHEIDLSTRRKELSILFVDIRGFSKISETVEEEHLERFLNDFLEAMTRSVFDNHGTVDKFLGDGLMAFFGDPLELENHALAAIGAAQQMQREMIPLNARWSKAGIQELSKGVHIRVGINTGMVVVGNIGSRRRMEYTVIGSAVNVASRLQEVASADGILISARTYDLTGGHVTCKEPRMIRVKGAD